MLDLGVILCNVCGIMEVGPRDPIDYLGMGYCIDAPCWIRKPLKVAFQGCLQCWCLAFQVG